MHDFSLYSIICLLACFAFTFNGEKRRKNSKQLQNLSILHGKKWRRKP